MLTEVDTLGRRWVPFVECVFVLGKDAKELVVDEIPTLTLKLKLMRPWRRGVRWEVGCRRRSGFESGGGGLWFVAVMYILAFTLR